MKAIPRATAKRLPIYHRYLRILQDQGKHRISSTELSDSVMVDSATIRRDFSYFGELGKRGYGYDVDYLVEFFGEILHQGHLSNVALIGVGNLGRALLNYNFRKDHNIRISCAFDISPGIVDTIQQGVPVYSMKDLEKQLQEQAINVVILTVPQETAVAVVNRLVTSGVRGIMNFTPLRFDVPDSVYVQNVDLTNELQTLIYYIENTVLDD